MPILNKEKAIALFCIATTKHTEATQAGEYKVGNAAYAQIVEAVKWLKDNQETKLLQPLLTASSTSTRLWAATCLLTVCKKEAEAVLIELASLQSISSFSAKMTLQEWRAGRLQTLI